MTDYSIPILIPLNLIVDNPFQTRLGYDAERIKALADSIRTSGLLQPPVARRVEGVWQLAFGHSRLRAYRLLAQSDTSGMFAEMPLIVRDLNDTDMAIYAWTENQARSDISAYEQATAIERYLQQFGWNHTQAATCLGIDRSTVTNKLRLLKLPRTTLDQLQSGALSERQAAALLPLMELPESCRSIRVGCWVGSKSIASAQELIDQAVTFDSATLRRAVETVLNELTISLDAEWAREHYSIAGVQSPNCSECPIRIRLRNRCPDRTCSGLKSTAWRAQQAHAAAVTVDLPVHGHLNLDEVDGLADINLATLRTLAQERSCVNLGVVYDSKRTWWPHVVDGHPHCRIVCVHGPGKRCRCKSALLTDPASGKQAKERSDRAQIRSEIARPAAQALAAVLDRPTSGMWYHLLGYVAGNVQRKLVDQSEARDCLARELIQNALKSHFEWGQPNVDEARKVIAQLLTNVGAVIPWDDA